MLRFLLDANLSPRTATYLSSEFGFDVFALSGTSLQSLSDSEIVVLAKAERRIIITLDEDFGEIYFRRERGNVGVIVLRLTDQFTAKINQRLDDFFRSEVSVIQIENSLVVLSERRVRVVTLS